MPDFVLPRPARRAPRALTVVAMTLLFAACSGGGGGDGGADPADADVSISANNNQFSTQELRVPAGEAFTLAFTNEEGAAHNVAIYVEQGGEALFVGEIFNGPDRTEVYEVPALEPGEYYFHCDVHPEMNGTVIAE